MSIKSININFDSTSIQEDLEIIIVRICQNKYVDIEFDFDYEAEIKIHQLYTYYLENKPAYSKIILNIIFNLLKRTQVSGSNFDTIYHLIASLERIKPADTYNIIKNLINGKKFINLNSANGLNLHLNLVNLYMNLITDETDIKFLKNNLELEVRSGNLFATPSFYNVSLRFYIKFFPHLYFHALDHYILRADSEPKTQRLIFSLEEFEREERSFHQIYKWVSEKSLNLQHEKNEKLSNFLKRIYEWIKTRNALKKDPVAYLIEAGLYFATIQNQFAEIRSLVESFIEEFSRRLIPDSDTVFDFADLLYNNIGRYYRIEPLRESPKEQFLCICPLLAKSYPSLLNPDYTYLKLTGELADLLSKNTGIKISETKVFAVEMNDFLQHNLIA